MINARDLFKKSTRLDIIFKYLYVKHRDTPFFDFYKDRYLESIKYFNGFYENIPRKVSPDDFVRHFDANIHSIADRGLLDSVSKVTLSDDCNVYDGAHRFAICAALEIDIDPLFTDQHAKYDFDYFRSRGMPEELLDFAALNTAIENDNTYVINVHSCVPSRHDIQIEHIISRRASIYYKKEINLDFNGYVNLKKFTYDSALSGKSWVGNVKSGFDGAVDHAKASFGEYPLRAYLIIADKLEDVLVIKEEIRELCMLGNYSVHTTDNPFETIDLAQYVFNENSLKFISHLPFIYDHRTLLKRLTNKGISKIRYNHSTVLSGSLALELFGIRVSNDIDYLSTSLIQNSLSEDSHDDQIQYYPAAKVQLINNPLYFFYFTGFKILTIDVVLSMKSRRAEFPKDIADVASILRTNYESCKFRSYINYANYEHFKVEKNVLKNVKSFVKKLMRIAF